MDGLSQSNIQKARIELAAAFRWADRLGLSEGICNHFSYAPDADHFLINPRGYHWSELTASLLLLADRAGNVLEGEGEIEPTAFFIHSRVHLGLKQARCVLHTHMPYATAITVTDGGRVHMISQNSARFFGDIRYENRYEGLALDASEGDRICDALGDKHIAFLANHGVIVVGESIAKAFDDLYYLERACEIQCIAQSTGRPLKPIADDVARRARQQFEDDPLLAQGHLDAILRILDREEPDYSS